MTEARPDRKIVAVVNDLVFGSKIRGAAQQQGTAVVFARSADALQQAAAGADLILLDLETRWLDVTAVVSALKADASTAGVRIVAFGSHVNTEQLQSARAAGVDRVLARSAFVRVLGELLSGGAEERETEG